MPSTVAALPRWTSKESLCLKNFPSRLLPVTLINSSATFPRSCLARGPVPSKVANVNEYFCIYFEFFLAVGSGVGGRLFEPLSMT